MNKDAILNSRQWANYMIGYLHRNRISIATSDFRRMENLDALAITNKFKEILRIDILQNNETLGLSDCCKVKDDGDLIVAVCKDTILVIQNECEVNQQIRENKIDLN